jgi:flagellar biosynthesis GTPase FlhF
MTRLTLLTNPRHYGEADRDQRSAFLHYRSTEVIHDIADLDDIGQKLRVTWKKANDFMASFARDYFIVAQELKSGKYGNDWNMAKWSAHKIGVFESSIVRRLKAHADALADDERQERDRIEAEQQRAKRIERQAQQAEKEQKRQRRAVEQAEAVAAKAVKQEADAAAKEAREDERKRQKRNATSRKSYRERRDAANAVAKVAATDNSLSTLNPRLDVLLAECKHIEKISRIERGRRYAEMQEIVNKRQAGNNPATGKRWFWGAWCKTHIQRSERDIGKCIAEFIGHNALKLNDDNVVPLVGAGRF